MEKYKHRKSLICNFAVYKLAVESNYELFDEKPSRGDMNPGCCALVAFFLGIIVMLVCLALYKGYPDHIKEVFIGFPLLIILIFEFLTLHHSRYAHVLCVRYRKVKPQMG